MAQLTDTGYKSEMRRLRMVNRAADRREQRAPEGRQPMNDKERAAFQSQQHYAFRDMSLSEQSKLNSELASMWGQIPAHLQEKARKLVS